MLGFSSWLQFSTGPYESKKVLGDRGPYFITKAKRVEACGPAA